MLLHIEHKLSPRYRYKPNRTDRSLRGYWIPWYQNRPLVRPRRRRYYQLHPIQHWTMWVVPQIYVQSTCDTGLLMWRISSSCPYQIIDTQSILHIFNNIFGQTFTITTSQVYYKNIFYIQYLQYDHQTLHIMSHENICRLCFSSCFEDYIAFNDEDGDANDIYELVATYFDSNVSPTYICLMY